MNILVTAGPTREPIDPVRFISNRSTGKMGYAVASAAKKMGHEVTLISGPVCLSEPDGVEVVNVVTGREMLEAVEGHIDASDALIMVAAVADWRPRRVSMEKIKKTGEDALTLELHRTADILSVVKERKGDKIFVGFAAETGHPVDEAIRKMKDKGLDLVVANDIMRSDSGFGLDTNKVFFIERNGNIHDLPLLTKVELAGKIVEWVVGASG